MKKAVGTIAVVTVLIFAVSAIAADKVVVIPLGGKKAAGDAAAADVLAGKTFSNKDDVGIDGAMVNNGAITFTPGTTVQNVSEGYHNGLGSVVGDNDLVSGNIRSGVIIFNVSGDSNVVDTSTGDAVAADIRKGKKAFVNGNMVEGTTVYSQYGCNHSSLTWEVNQCTTECETDYPPIPATPDLCYDFCFRLSEAYGDFFLFNNQTTIYNVLCGALP